MSYRCKKPVYSGFDTLPPKFSHGPSSSVSNGGNVFQQQLVYQQQQQQSVYQQQHLQQQLNPHQMRVREAAFHSMQHGVGRQMSCKMLNTCGMCKYCVFLDVKNANSYGACDVCGVFICAGHCTKRRQVTCPGCPTEMEWT